MGTLHPVFTLLGDSPYCFIIVLWSFQNVTCCKFIWELSQVGQVTWYNVDFTMAGHLRNLNFYFGCQGNVYILNVRTVTYSKWSEHVSWKCIPPNSWWMQFKTFFQSWYSLPVLPGLDEVQLLQPTLYKPFFSLSTRVREKENETVPWDKGFQEPFVLNIWWELWHTGYWVTNVHPYSCKQPCQNKNVEPLMKIFKHPCTPRDTD